MHVSRQCKSAHNSHTSPLSLVVLVFENHAPINFCRLWCTIHFPRQFHSILLERAPPPKFWDVDYITGHISDHVAKFHGDRPREFGDLAERNEREKDIKQQNMKVSGGAVALRLKH